MRMSALEIALHREAALAIAAAARSSHPQETGGLLLGWWDAHRIVVRDAVEVVDPAAGPSSWTREEQPAQAVLEAALAERAHPWLGYLGDWHSHTVAVTASSQDAVSIRRASRAYREPLVLLVYRPDDVFEYVVAHRGRIRHASLNQQFSEGSLQQ